MPKAIWNNAILADSQDTRVVEGNHYFPPDSIDLQYFRDSSAHTHCGWKGTASYYDVVVGDQVNPEAAWYYPEPKSEAESIKGYVAFWRGVEVVD